MKYTLKPFLIIVFLCCVAKSFAQKSNSQSWINVVIGPSIPIGKYANPDPHQPSMGAAKTGEFVKLSISGFIKKNFGISAQINYQRNPLNTEKTNERLSGDYYVPAGATVVGPYGPYITPEPVTYPNRYKNWQVEKASWSLVNLMVGGYAEFPFATNKKLSLDIGADVGFVYAWSPDIHGKYTDDTLLITTTQKSKSAPGFSYALNTGLRYALNKNTQLTFHADYFGTNKIKFNKVTSVTYSTQPGNPFGSTSISSFTADRKQPVSNINIGAGIAFLL